MQMKLHIRRKAGKEEGEEGGREDWEKAAEKGASPLSFNTLAGIGGWVAASRRAIPTETDRCIFYLVHKRRAHPECQGPSSVVWPPRQSSIPPLGVSLTQGRQGTMLCDGEAGFLSPYIVSTAVLNPLPGRAFNAPAIIRR